MGQSRSVAIVGAGQTGVSAAVGFLNAGFDVTLLSDRDRAALRNDGPATGTAVTFAVAQAAERELGLDDYLGRAPRVTGQSTQVFSGAGAERRDDLDFDVEYDGIRAAGVDTRLKVDDRIGEFLASGGRFVVTVITTDTLDDVAAAHDLTLVATGRSGLSELFAVDHSRTVYDRPQRSLLMLTVAGLGHGTDVFAHRGPAGGEHNTFAIDSEQGELWWGPYLHKDAGPAWSFLGFAKPGSDWARRFEGAHDVASAHRIVNEVHRDYVDWDVPEIASTTVIPGDRHAWLRGAVTPTVRHAVGVTVSGHPVLALGDTAIAFDPIGAQGAQGGLIQSAQLVAAARDYSGPFDENWLHDRFEHFWSTRGAAAVLVTRLFLGDPEFAPYGQLFFPAAAASPEFGAALFGLLSDPNPLLRIGSRAAARRFITDVSGHPADELLARVPAASFRYSAYGRQDAVSTSVA
ncbi:styrene monooxygenase/indole monooxygenase family protein [Mycolicibacterium sp. 050158]|uniref:styrene monooxygenase/indole monooxygenase family protein n=1 Tax=Mycolicibacterium sp. 050158 TaxID=3090602 RepID=UPI00299D6713|nr:styrene monooxygenase/indole monooxygenase family protein [Mycolicibacterium sp. 050158]MDX1891141.1 styrene monooxygenase/indole monooxygenase family protein [Mycolicibacterium sp. 050158]